MVLVSGTGTLLQALIDAAQDPAFGVDIVGVGADRDGIEALARAERAGIATFVHPLAPGADRAAWDSELADRVAGLRPDLVISAGFMKLVGAAFLARFGGRMINTHPALLPAFPGLGSVEQAVAYGVKVFGVTVHFVDEGVDTGPIIAQRAIDVPGRPAAGEVRAALRPVEHDLLTGVVALIARGAVSVDPADPRHVTVRA